MGRRKGRSTDRSDDAFDVSTDSEVLRSFIKKTSVLPSPIVTETLPRPLRLFKDNRLWQPPEQKASPGALPRSAGRLRPAEAKALPGKLSALSPRVTFSKPGQVSVCVRRKTRKQVLFALGKTRKGAGAKRRRRTAWSDTKCSTRF